MDAKDTGFDHDVSQHYAVTAAVVGSVIVSSLLLVVAGAFVIDRPAAAAGPSELTAIWVLIVFIAAGSFVLRRVLNNWERLRTAKLLKGLPGLLATLRANAIILAAVAESIVVAGFIAAYLTGEKFDLYRAAAAALIVFAINFPRRSVWLKVAEALRDV